MQHPRRFCWWPEPMQTVPWRIRLNGQRDLTALALELCHDLTCFADELGFAQRLADVHSGRGHEGVGNPAADDQLIDLFRELCEDRELGRNLRATDDRNQRPARIPQ